jgi:hypothetical protein
MKNVTITKRLLQFMMILSYCRNLYLAVTITDIVFIAVKSCMFVKVYYPKTSLAEILTRFRVVDSVNKNKDTYKIFVKILSKML